jgi:hypothetical protein
MERVRVQRDDKLKDLLLLSDRDLVKNLVSAITDVRRILAEFVRKEEREILDVPRNATVPVNLSV